MPSTISHVELVDDTSRISMPRSVHDNSGVKGSGPAGAAVHMCRRFPSAAPAAPLPMMGGGGDGTQPTTTTTAKAWSLPRNRIVVAVVLYIVSAIILMALQPPVVCKSNARDDLDAFHCSYSRVFVWALLAPALYFIIPLFM